MPKRDVLRVRTYPLAHAANPAKIEAVRNILPLWQRGLVHVQWVQVQNMKAGQRLGLLDTKQFPSYLTQRQWKSVVNQVNGGLRSWQGLAVNAVREMIRDANLEQDERSRLYRLNKARNWWSDPTLAQFVTRAARTTTPFPNFSAVTTMLLDGPIAQIEESKTAAFDKWVRVTTGPNTPVVRIPLRSNSYADTEPGVWANFTQVQVRPTEPSDFF